ncbi:hypothetical protein N0V90_011207 [Kalmusia sp. IMI 367209]|nr:hypothetical protein N0V90_011207 [Kalmusia sp. IMI 367209]
MPASGIQVLRPDLVSQFGKLRKRNCMYLQPLCVFTPRGVEDIAAAVPILKSTKTHFAVRGNGHMTVKGAASTSNGVLIVLTKFRELVISADRNTASIGPGITWLEVYQWVQKHDRTIVGGRYGPVGVSGLLLGGGISFHSGQYGWAANSVVAYEVVTADGRILQASKKTNSDLFWALKGGSSNFGIVTRFDVQTHPTGQIYGGIFSWNASNVHQAVDALAAFAAPGGGIDDPKVALLPNIAIDPASGIQSASIFGFYDGVDDTILQNFTNSALATTAKIRTYADFIAEGSAGGARGNFRGAFHCASFKASAQTVKMIHETVTKDAIKNLAKVPGVFVALSIQPLGKSWLKAAQKAGGDAIDIDPSNGNLIVLNLVIQWADAADDAKIADWANSILTKLGKQAATLGLNFPFVYINDAQAGAQPFQYYGGGKSLSKLLQTRRKYDPQGVFQDLMPGGFKLGK